MKVILKHFDCYLLSFIIIKIYGFRLCFLPGNAAEKKEKRGFIEAAWSMAPKSVSLREDKRDGFAFVLRLCAVATKSIEIGFFLALLCTTAKKQQQKKEKKNNNYYFFDNGVPRFESIAFRHHTINYCSFDVLDFCSIYSKREGKIILKYGKKFYLFLFFPFVFRGRGVYTKNGLLAQKQIKWKSPASWHDTKCRHDKHTYEKMFNKFKTFMISSPLFVVVICLWQQNISVKIYSGFDILYYLIVGCCRIPIDIASFTPSDFFWS